MYVPYVHVNAYVYASVYLCLHAYVYVYTVYIFKYTHNIMTYRVIFNPRKG